VCLYVLVPTRAGRPTPRMAPRFGKGPQRREIQMDVSLPRTEGAIPSRAGAAVSRVEIPQYRLPGILAVWAAAALPMAALAWLVAPALADRFSGGGNLPLVKALLICITVGLIWQFVLVVVLVGREQRSLRWSVLREALWLRSPRSPRSDRVGGRVWLILIPLIVAFAAEELISLPGPANRDMGLFLESDAGQTFLSGNWAWFGLLLVLWVFNTVLGEELLFRGLLLPRMNGVFGRGDWVGNGVLFAAYHLHTPWSIPTTLLDTLILSYPTKRYRSAWVGIAVHSAQSVVLAAIVLMLVLR
jgi:membrane protease YdiL (CAAX protease family)